MENQMNQADPSLTEKKPGETQSGTPREDPDPFHTTASPEVLGVSGSPEAVSPVSPPEPLLAPEAVAQAGEEYLRAALEGLLFVHNRPIPTEKIGELLSLTPDQTRDLIVAVKSALDEDPRRGLQLIINEEGVQLATKACISQVIQRLEGQKLVSLSLPALETLSVVAFKQPITKAEIEAIRGVNCDGVISTLLEKKLIYVSGEKPVVGRPRLYSTTQDFLYYFGLKSLKELPTPLLDISEQELAREASPEELKEMGREVADSMGLEEKSE
jgi:segregation and condensation protein B